MEIHSPEVNGALPLWLLE